MSMEDMKGAMHMMRPDMAPPELSCSVFNTCICAWMETAMVPTT
jgi:hypothetical protein